MATNVVALFDSRDDAQRAVSELVSAGFSHRDISVVAQGQSGDMQRENVDDQGNLAGEGASAGITSGAVVGGAIGLLAGIGLGFVPFLGFLVAGPVAGLITGAAAGAATGGILGALIGLGIPENEAHVYAESVRRGGTLVTVHVNDDSRADEAHMVLDRCGAVDVDERGAQLRSQGFERYDENAPATGSMTGTGTTMGMAGSSLGDAGGSVGTTQEAGYGTSGTTGSMGEAGYAGSGAASSEEMARMRARRYQSERSYAYADMGDDDDMTNRGAVPTGGINTGSDAGVRHGIDDDPNNDPEKARNIGGVGGAATGAIAGAAAGPIGAIGGAIVGGVVGALGSQAAVSAVDKHDNDNTITGIGGNDRDATGTPGSKPPGVPNNQPGIQTGGRNADGSPDTRGITEKAADAITGDDYDDKTGKRTD